MSSAGAASTTAKPSRDITSTSTATMTSDNYRLLLPTLPTGNISLHTVFLHADPAARPYRADDFAGAVFDIIEKDDVAQFGAYLYNHVWALTLHSRLPKEKLATKKQITVKNKKCLIIDPNQKEVKLSLHWLPLHVSDNAVVNALGGYGKVERIEREKWRSTAFAGAETTTRKVSMVLRDGVTVDSIPHLCNVLGGQVLVDIPGRPPLCLRCKRVGHLRRLCKTPWCKTCRGFGHVEEDCISTYASKTRIAVEDATEIMDVEEHTQTEGTMVHQTRGVEDSEALTCAGDTNSEDPASCPEMRNGERVGQDVSEEATWEETATQALAEAATKMPTDAPSMGDTRQDHSDIRPVRDDQRKRKGNGVKDGDSEGATNSQAAANDERDEMTTDWEKNEWKWKGPGSSQKKSRFTPAPLITPEDRRQMMLKEQSK